MRKPYWINKKINLADCREIKKVLRAGGINTVCERSLCPNMSECFARGCATFMIMGDICTRGCSFCAVSRGAPLKPDDSEPARVRDTVTRLKLSYVVITSPTRDDLADGGAGFFCRTVKEIKRISPAPGVEILVPDFLGREEALREVSFCGADVVAHNVETVPRLYHYVRSSADYIRSLDVLKLLKKNNPFIRTKSGIMLGLGETEEEVISVFRDLSFVSCDFLTIGQYLAPSVSSFPVKDYLSQERFDYFANIAAGFGFKKIQSSPYTRSSYLASL